MIPTRGIAIRVMAQALRRQPTSAGKAQLAWNMVVGASMTQLTRPALAADGTVTITTTIGIWTQKLLRSRPRIATRLRSVLGPDIMKAIRITTKPKKR